MALYRQDPSEAADQSEPQSGIIRGSLPPELRGTSHDLLKPRNGIQSIIDNHAVRQ